jgi:hypothetical protein
MAPVKSTTENATMTDKTQNNTTPVLLLPREFAQRMRVSVRTIANWEDRGILSAIRIGGKVLYLESDIARLVKRAGK